jgi:O-methyltransferase involved in polyketide biosynthesis
MEREKITFTGAQETMLATLYARALDSRRPRSVLHDHAADEAVQRIDYDFRKTGIKGTSAIGVAIRAKQLDIWTAEFLTKNPSATVLHLACGLDTRVQRLEPAQSVRWLDVDYPEVIALRDRLLPKPTGDYQELSTSVTAEDWLEEVPADRPTVAVFEGLSMYLRKEEGKRLIERITGRFPSGQLLFDCYSTLGVKLQKGVPALRNAKATLYWGIDDPQEIEAWHPSLKCVDAMRSADMPGLEVLPLAGRIAIWTMARLPKLRDMGRILRYTY